jgi:chitinase
MKLRSKLLTVAAVTITGLGVAIVPSFVANAAEACAPAWSASQVYVGGNVASYQSHNYRAKWWSQGDNPATHSGQWDVWADQGACGGTTPPPTTPPPTGPPPSNGTKMPAAPYIYPGWGNPPPPSTVMSATGIRSFTIAFVLASGCNAVWDGEGGLTGGSHESTINAIKAAGGTVIPSFGGWSGNKLGPACPTAARLAEQYQRVINTFGLRAIDIDIENTDEFQDHTVAGRIVDALKIIKQNNAGVTTILTFGTTQSGPNTDGVWLINDVKAKNAGVDIFTQMPFDFGNAGTNMYTATVNASEGLKNQLKQTFGWTDAQAYSHMGISGMNGLSDTGKITTVQNWQDITNYAKSHNFARLAFWAVNRDRPCPGGGLSSECSSIAQDNWKFTSISAGF